LASVVSCRGYRFAERVAAPLSRWYNDITFPLSSVEKTRCAAKKEKKMRVLVVDDDPPSLKMTAFLLQDEGHTVLTADDGRRALEMIDKEVPDLVILDVMMPYIDGLEVCRRVRQHLNVPIIILSAKGETSDRVQGLDLGADDYLAKPFEPSELLARVKAVMRRTDAFSVPSVQERLTVDELTLDAVGNQAILADGKTIDLTPIEFRLLHALMRNAGRTMTHDMLLNAVWGYDYAGYSNQVAVYMRRLRAKIEENPDNPRRLTTVRGLGYRFEKG
jgi:DNA-binding response OmpR family regulator